MRDVLIFNGASNLEFQEIRTSVIRIPEVVARIREAQSLWDQIADTELDLINFIGSEDGTFLGHIRLKSFASAVVQIGLLDRYLKNARLPEFVVGAINGDSPMQVAVGKMTFAELVGLSPATSNFATRTVSPSVNSNSFDLPVLTGVELVEYAAFRRNAAGEFMPLLSSERDFEKMIVELIESYDVSRLISVGPGHSVFGRRMAELTSRDVQVLESIDLDPMLSWFWTHMKESRLAVAN